MTPPNAIGDPDRAAALLLHAFTNHELLASLPSDIRPRSRSEAYNVQTRLVELMGQRTCGWKIAATSEAGQRHIGVSGPIAGRVLADNLYADGDVLPLEHNAMLVAEVEMVFMLAAPILPRTSLYALEDVLDAVGALHLGIELPSTRYVDPTVVGEAQLLADNACSGDFLLGPAVADAWRTVDLSSTIVTVEVNGPTGSRSAVGVGANVLGHPLTALTWLVNELSALRLPLEAGQFVTTGSCCVPMPIQSMDVLTAHFSELGTVACAFDDAGRNEGDVAAEPASCLVALDDDHFEEN